MTRRSTSYQLANAAMPVDDTIPHIPSAADRYATATAKVRDNKPKTGEPAMTDGLIPLGWFCPSEGFDLGVVTRCHAGQLVRNRTGLLCLPEPVVAAMIDERDRRAEAERQRVAAELAQAQAGGNLARERRRQRAATQRQLVGTDGEPLDPRQALAVLKEADGSRDRELDAAAAERNELLGGELRWHSYRESGRD
jgi:hypothetical protein